MPRSPSKFARTRAESQSPASIITAAIIAKLEEGVSPWRKPWTGSESSSRPQRACGTPYRGINVIWLWSVAERMGYSRSTWMTYRQAQAVGGQVRRGETGTIAVFYKAYSATEQDSTTGEESTSTRRVLKTYTVFNVEQIDNLPERFAPCPPRPALTDLSHRDAIEDFIDASGAEIIHGGDRACYIPALDRIHMPETSAFETYAQYGAVACHELSHWTGHTSRLNRDLNNRFGTDKYAAEELVAELSSAFLGADLGLPVGHLDNHASYIDSWLSILRKDDRALLTAAAKAEEAAAYLLAKAGRQSSSASDAPENHDDRADVPVAIAA